MTPEALEGAFANTRAVLANVTPDQYGDPTPCASWTVRELVNHIVEGANWFPLCVNAGAAPDPDPIHGVDYAADDPATAFDMGAKEAVAAFAAGRRHRASGQKGSWMIRSRAPGAATGDDLANIGGQWLMPTDVARLIEQADRTVTF
ncbi:MAG: maleylpyruvate isomerase N-terminal domain-containing protein [Acidimicrobiales bacterium]